MKDYFCGWYLKCQNEFQTLALIPAFHITNNAKSCSLQVITRDGSWCVQYPSSQFCRDNDSITMGENHFGKWGCRLNVNTESLKIRGELCFGPFSTIAYDIMGPFRYIPFLECRHSVYSMQHRVDGAVSINGEEFLFEGGVGYLEGDRGYSFPREYLWGQCSFPEGSLMLSVAEIPLCGIYFTGVIGLIRHRGKEYRLATYLGARAVRIREGGAVIRQGNLTFTIRRLEDKGRPLAAPVAGEMKRTIRESTACRCFFRLQEKGRIIFEFISPEASFEYEYSR